MPRFPRGMLFTSRLYPVQGRCLLPLGAWGCVLSMLSCQHNSTEHTKAGSAATHGVHLTPAAHGSQAALLRAQLQILDDWGLAFDEHAARLPEEARTRLRQQMLRTVEQRLEALVEKGSAQAVVERRFWHNVQQALLEGRLAAFVRERSQRARTLEPHPISEPLLLGELQELTRAQLQLRLTRLQSAR